MRTVLAAASVVFACGVAQADDVDVIHAGAAKRPSVLTLHVEPVRVGDPPVALIRVFVHREKWRELRACYEGGLRKNPRLGGRVAVDFSVAASGAVSGARAASTTVPDADVVRCMVHAFASLVFPRMRAALDVRYPVVLSPNP